MKNLLSQFGYPLPGDNIRRKSASLYDNGTFATGTLQYNLFTNPALSVYNRNRTLPLSGSEVFFINELKVWVDLTEYLTNTFPVLTLMKESFLQIFIDEREKIKVPLMECLNFYFSDRISEGVAGLQFAHTNQTAHNKRRMLQKPIVINANSNIVAKIVTNATSATAFNGITFKVYFDGIKYDKLNDFEIDFVKNNKYEELSYSIYDVITLSASEETLDCFGNRNKAETLFNKNLPLSDKESFQVEAIEMFGTGSAGTSDLQLATNEMKNFFLEVVIDDTKFLETTNLNMFSVGISSSRAFQDDGTNDHRLEWLNIHRSVYVLPVPIIIPANSKASVKVRHGALTHISGTMPVVFKGTLTRQVN